MVAVVALATSQIVANAQDTELGTRLPKNARSTVIADKSRSAKAGRGWAFCAVHKRRSIAQNMLSTRDRGAFEKSLQWLARDIECLRDMGGAPFADGTRINMPVDLERGVLAEAFLSDLDVNALPNLPLEKTYHAPWNIVSGRNIAVDEMAVCVAASAPGSITSLLKTVPETREEEREFSALGATLGPCLSAKTRLTASRQALRASLSEALYQRAINPVAAGVTAGAAPEPKAGLQQ